MNFLAENISYLLETQPDLAKKFQQNFDKLDLEKISISDLERISAFFQKSMDALVKQKMKTDAQKLPQIKMLVLDVDGVLTDGGVYYSESGDDAKKFNVKDGMGILQLRKRNFPVGIISSSLKADYIERRAADLKIEHIYVGKVEKLSIIKEWCRELGIAKEQIAYIGDDINDKEIMQYVGISACPNDAVDSIKALCSIVLNNNGGMACVREFIDKFIV